MSNEAQKSKVYFGKLEQKVFIGKGIDIGCGNDPIFKDVKCFDIQDGDANEITKYVKEKFDFVFSSHCLEHMKNPYYTICQWWELVKDNGYLFVIVPDEDLYEQKHFPSKFNYDHKWTFTLLKDSNTTLRSINIIELIATLKNARLMKIEVQDNLYNYKLINVDQTKQNVCAQILFCVQKNNKYKNFDYKFNKNLSFIKKILLIINCFFVNIVVLPSSIFFNFGQFIKSYIFKNQKNK